MYAKTFKNLTMTFLVVAKKKNQSLISYHLNIRISSTQVSKFLSSRFQYKSIVLQHSYIKNIQFEGQYTPPLSGYISKAALSNCNGLFHLLFWKNSKSSIGVKGLSQQTSLRNYQDINCNIKRQSYNYIDIGVALQMYF